MLYLCKNKIYEIFDMDQKYKLKKKMPLLVKILIIKILKFLFYSLYFSYFLFSTVFDEKEVNRKITY